MYMAYYSYSLFATRHANSTPTQSQIIIFLQILFFTAKHNKESHKTSKRTKFQMILLVKIDLHTSIISKLLNDFFHPKSLYKVSSQVFFSKKDLDYYKDYNTEAHSRK